jgi:hypothetical protein
MYNRSDVLTYNSFINQNELNSMFENWFRNYYRYATPTPTASPSVTPTPTPGVDQDELDYYFTSISKSRAQDYYDYGDRFILVYYDSGRSGYHDKLDTIKKAIIRAEQQVFYFDDKNQGDYSWFADEIYSSTIPNPCVFLLDDSEIIDTIHSFSSVNSISNRIRDFLYYELDY